VFAGTIANSTNNSALNMTMNGASIWSLKGTNTFSGGVTLNDGKLIVSSLATNGSIGSGNFRMGGFANVPVLEYVGSGDTNNKQMRLGAGPAATGGRILNNGTGALVFTNANFISGADVQTAGLNRAVIFGGTNTADNAITGVIANVNPTNTVSIVKDELGKWVLSGNNTYTGGTTISNGILQIGAGGTTGSVQGSIANNGSLIFNRSDATTVTNAISGSGSVTKNAANTLTLSGANTFSGNVAVSSGTLIATGVADSGSSSLGTGTQLTLGGSATVSFTASSNNTTTRSLVLGGTGGNALKNSGSGALVWSGNVINNTTANGADFTLGGSGTGGNEFSGLLTNNGANAMRLIKAETGTWKVSGANTFTSLLDVFNGTLVVTTMANSGTASSVGAGTTIRFGGFAGETGVLEYVGSGSTNNKQFKLGGGGTANTGGTILNNGTGALVFNNAAFNTVGDGAFSGTTRALTLGGSNTADNAISGVIRDNNSGNTVSVVKDGTGKWILSGSNTYSGTTTVNAGNLVVERANLTATILSNSVAVAFSPAPSEGTYTILPGALAANSLGSTSVTGLGNGQTATVVNSPNLVVQVTDAPTGPSYEDTYSGIDPLAINPANGLSYLMNYALGGTGVGSNPALPVLTSDGTSLTLTANIRDSSQGVTVVGEYTYDLAGDWIPVVLTPTGASSSVANTTVQSFTQNVEAGRPKKFMRFRATKNP
jgi:fibronectin-binding autotransporter adhesin